MMKDKVLILDFGSQFTQLIAKKIRSLNIFCEIMLCSVEHETIVSYAPQAIILSGSAQSVADDSTTRVPQIIYSLSIPILGICYGQQAIAKDFGSRIISNYSRSYGASTLTVLQEDPFFGDFWKKEHSYKVWMSHSDHIVDLAKTFIILAKTDDAPYAIIKYKNKPIYGVQFHPEVYHTSAGTNLLRQFLVKIAHIKQIWQIQDFIQESVSHIRSRVGNKKIALAFSGGIDSTVVASILYHALKEQLYCILIDNGFLRYNELFQIQRNFRNNFNTKLIKIDASDLFISALKNVTDPETKRKLIGKLFSEVLSKKIISIGNIDFFAQGTIYPDCIESCVINSNKKVTIKSHHNVGAFSKIGFLGLVEPLKFLFKDEVKILAQKLKVNNTVLHQHPFPGPGLAIRILGRVNKDKCRILQKADYIYISILRERGFYHKIWQAYAALLPTKTVGVMGDDRTYEYICLLRAVVSVDGMTADSYHLPHSILGLIARRIVNEVSGINRVVYDITSKPPATIELE